MMAGRNARWMRLGPLDARALREAALGLAGVQAPDAAPITLWARDGERYGFALVAPQRDAPGRPARWVAWALAPAIATYRQFGLPAYRDGDALCLDGRPIARCAASAEGACVVAVSSFQWRFAPERGGALPASPEFRAWLREGLALATRDWAANDALPAERTLEETFRARLEAQYGWRFEHAWPSAEESASIRGALPAMREPVPLA